jgi:hypothetical protein
MKLLLPLLLSTSLVAHAQMQVNAPIFLEAGASIYIENMDLNTTADISGAGKVILSGNVTTAVNSTNNQLPSLTINKTSGSQININGNPEINGILDFTNGTAQLTASNLTLNNSATIQNASASKYIKTTGLGSVLKKTNTALSNFQLPIGTSTQFAPLGITNSCACTNAVLGGRVVNSAHPNKLASAVDYLNIYWPVTMSGTMSNARVTGTYNDPSNVVGNSANLSASFYSAGAWNVTNGNNNTASDSIGKAISTSGDLYGQGAFVYLNAKAMLMGPYSAATNRMADGLRTPTNLIPLADPYRTAPYNTSFIHVNNGTAETAAASVFAVTDPNNAIVDWVFLELRNTTTGNAGANKVKTRSALIQRAGDIVDVDGISPVVFRDVVPGNYAIAIRHRNHLGLCTDPAPVNLFQLTENPTGSALVDFTILTDAKLFGKADSNYFINKTSNKNVLWAGNANVNTRVSFNGGGNDKDKVLNSLGGNPTNTTVSNVYNESDVNMNRNVRFLGGGNDKDFILNNVLNLTATNIRNQALPQ